MTRQEKCTTGQLLEIVHANTILMDKIIYFLIWTTKGFFLLWIAVQLFALKSHIISKNI